VRALEAVRVAPGIHLDSGASISVLGTGCQELVDRLKLDWLPYRGNVKTANGEDQGILGKAIVRVSFWRREDSMCLCLCPALKQQLYLGVDFWKEFDIAPELFGGSVEELVESLPKEVTTVKPERYQLRGPRNPDSLKFEEFFFLTKRLDWDELNF